MPAPTCRVLYICHSPFRLVYQLHQLDPRDLADPKCKETRVQIKLRQKHFMLCKA